MTRPTTDEAKKAAGTYTPARKRTPLNLPIGCPEPPRWLTIGGRCMWDMVVSDLSESGVIASVDWITLAPLCELLSEFSENPRGFSTSKLALMMKLAAENGCSLGARLKIKSPEGMEPGNEKLDKEKPCPQGAKVVSISRLLSATPKGSSPEKSQPADMSDSPANAS